MRHLYFVVPFLTILCGCASAPVAPGRHHIGVYATHLGEVFYSFFTAKLSDGKDNHYDIVFRNDLESNRAFLHFDVIIPKG